MARPQHAPRPLFQFDPGWLYLLPGLALCLAAVLIPAQEDLRQLELQRDQLKLDAQHAQLRLKAHADFLSALDQDDPGLYRRLIATQLNLIPAEDTPVLMVATDSAAVTDWIDQTVPVRPSLERVGPESRLSRLTTGSSRLWLLAGAMMCLCLGLVLSPGGGRRGRGEGSPPAGETSRTAGAVSAVPAVAPTARFAVAGELDEPADEPQDESRGREREPWTAEEGGGVRKPRTEQPCEIVVRTTSPDHLMPQAGSRTAPARDQADFGVDSEANDDRDRLAYPETLFDRGR